MLEILDFIFALIYGPFMVFIATGVVVMLALLVYWTAIRYARRTYTDIEALERHRVGVRLIVAAIIVLSVSMLFVQPLVQLVYETFDVPLSFSQLSFALVASAVAVCTLFVMCGLLLIWRASRMEDDYRSRPKVLGGDRYEGGALDSHLRMHGVIPD